MGAASRNREALLPLLESRFASQPRDHWLGLLAKHDIPAAPVQTMLDFMSDPAVRHLDMVHDYDHPNVGPLRLMGQPLVFSETSARDPGPPPTLGEHTNAVLGELGYDATAISDLRTRGVVGGPPA